MKKRDTILFGLPLIATLLVAAFAAFLCWQTSEFERSYLEENRAGIAQSARLAAAVLQPMLNDGHVDEAIAFCRSFDRDALRVTLVDSKGKVVADSRGNTGFMDNHQQRAEVQKALKGVSADSMRYSESLDQWMIYYATPLKTSKGVYVLRAAISTDRVRRIIDFARLNMFWALLFGGEIMLVLFLYIIRRIRTPLAELQLSIDKIASGSLNARIEIPESGIVRELAIGVSEMTDQLKNRLAETVSERNEKNTLLETMSDAVLLFDAEGALLRSNAAAEKLFGFDRESEFHLTRCRVSGLAEQVRKTLQTGTPFEREFSAVREGAERSLFVKGRILNEEGNRRILLTVTELTNLHRLESFRSDFIANVSHEIKTPLTCILGAVEALEENGDDLSPSRRGKLLDMLKMQSRRLNNLVRDILSLAALEKQQTEPKRNFCPVALDLILANVLHLCAARAAESDVALRITRNDPVTLEADGQLLEQAVVNLVENAIKYSGGKNVELSLEQRGGEAVVTVADDGTGIAPEHYGRIFERFYRVDKSRSRELGGTGLGLAIVKHIAQLHGGRATGENGPVHGACFHLILPLD